jgi:uncharacterized membrane protein YhaH (DUF805 family)
MEPQPTQPQPQMPPAESIYPQPAASPAGQLEPPAEPQPQGMFSGRLNRIGYFLGGIYLIIPLLILVGLQLSIHGSALSSSSRIGVNLISVLVGLAVVILIIPAGISLGIRRWHDLNQSGWFVLLGFIPFINCITAIILLFVPGTKGPNTYGPPDSSPSSPKKVLFGK